MVTAGANRMGRVLALAIGRRTGRERRLLTLTALLVVLVLCYRGWLAPALAGFHEERIRLAAGRALNQKLVDDLAARDELMAKAEVQIEGYLATWDVASSIVFLERVQGSERRGTRMQSFHVSGDGGSAGNARFHVVLHGSPEAIAETFLDLALEQPPMVLRQLLVRGHPGAPTEVTASATLETIKGPDDAEWADLFDHWNADDSTGSVEGGDRLGARSEVPRGSPPPANTGIDPPPWKHGLRQVLMSPWLGGPAAAATTSARREGAANRPVTAINEHGQRFEYLGRRDLFESVASGGGSSSARGGTSVQVAASDLSLVGTVGGQSPLAILQERSTGKRHYLRSGEYLGEIQVVRISQRSVVLRYKGEELSLP